MNDILNLWGNIEIVETKLAREKRGMKMILSAMVDKMTLEEDEELDAILEKGGGEGRKA